MRAAPGPAGCAEIYAHGVRIGVRFTNFLSLETLRLVVRADFMIANHEASAARTMRR